MSANQDEETRIAKRVVTFHQIFGEKEQWSLHSGKWHRLQGRHAFKRAQRLSVRVLQLYGNKQPQVIREISWPLMEGLVVLNLKNNRITSMQGLSQLQAANLKELLLGDNDIVSLKHIAKLHAPQLTLLSLYSNRINDLSILPRCHFPKLKILILGLNSLANFIPTNKADLSELKTLSLENNCSCGSTLKTLLRWIHSIEVIC